MTARRHGRSRATVAAPGRACPRSCPALLTACPCTTPEASRPCRGHRRGKAVDPAPARGDPAARKPDRRTFLTASYSVLLYACLPTPVPPDPGNAQAVPGINLRVNSQTNIRAQLVKQSYSARQANDDLYLFSLWWPSPCMYLSAPQRPPLPAPASPRGCPRGRTARQAGRARRPAAAGKAGAKGGQRAGKGVVADGNGGRCCP